VTPVAQRPAACSKLKASGLGITEVAGTVMLPAYPPETGKPITSSPTSTSPAGPVASAPTAVTTPATSEPSGIGSRLSSEPSMPL
jgi:hypothetical protein